MKTSTIPTLLLAGTVLFIGGHLPAQVSPFIKITNAPPFGAGGYLEGYASCDKTNACGVAVYIKVNDGWWNKPTHAQPLSSIDSNGYWRCNVATYPPSDVWATKYSAFLVPLSASSEVPLLDDKPLSAKLDDISLASDFRVRTPLLFSGMEWECKVNCGFPIDPGPSWFSTNNAWVDDIGRLHLKITNEVENGTNKWYCAEVVCGEALGYGLYRFYLDSPVATFDPSIVFSPFIYSDYADYAHREVDIEFTTWNDRVTNGNAQYTIQQWSHPAITNRFTFPADVSSSVHSFVWAPCRIDFKSLQGHDPMTTNSSDLIEEWSLPDSNLIPPGGSVRPRISLYLSANQPPTDSNEVEVIISRFEYRPLPAYPFIEITNMPAFGSNSGLLRGQAYGGAAPSNCCSVAVYIKVNDGWWNKPSISEPLTPINADGSWICDVTSAMSDAYATKFAAFLVPSDARNDVPIVDGKPLPEQLDEISLGKDFKIRTSLHFAGMEWEIKATVPEPLGRPIDPGPNWFSTNNVWVDGTGRLHLTISKEVKDGSTNWSCAEVICGHAFSNGLYRFCLDSPVGSLDPNVVFSPFTYSDSSNYSHRETDIEFTTWNGTATNGNAQYTIHAPDGTDVVERFDCPPNVTNSVQWFVWAPWRMDFKSLRGHDPASTNSSDLIKEWSFSVASRIPPGGLVRPRICLYLSNSQPPTDGARVEVIVSRFEYQPLLRFLDVRRDPTGKKIQFATQQEVAGRLELESCTNFTSTTNYWESEINLWGEVGEPMPFEFSTNHARRFFRGSLREQ